MVDLETEKFKQWIDNASYFQLLKKNRFAAIGDPLFQGETGKYYLKVMAEKRQSIGNDAHVATSKAIGW